MISPKSKRFPLALGFIGGGLSSAIGQTHFGASQLDGRWKVEAGCFSRQAQNNHDTGNAWHINPDRLYDSWEQFLEKEAEKLDAVAVLTPTPEHVGIVCALLEKKIPVICEKPLVSSLTEVSKIQKVLQQGEQFLAVTFNYSGYPMVRELRELIKDGALGQIKQIRFEVPQEVFMRSPNLTGSSTLPQSWRLKDGNIPTICLDLGVHLHHLAYFLIGEEPIQTMAEFSNYSSYSNLVDDILMWLKFDSGTKGSFWMSKSALGNRNGLQISLYGDKGSASWIQIEPEILKLSSDDGTCTTLDRASRTIVCGSPRYNRYKAGHPAGFIEAFANLYSDIADALIQYDETGKHHNPYVFGFDHSVKGLNLFTAACKSNKYGSWQDLEPFVCQ
jgi:predicted dehydrogenase